RAPRTARTSAVCPAMLGPWPQPLRRAFPQTGCGRKRNRNRPPPRRRRSDTSASSAAAAAPAAGSLSTAPGDKSARRSSGFPGLGGGAEENVLEVGASGLLGEFLQNFTHRAVNDLPA